jgi:hypothetical protein
LLWAKEDGGLAIDPRIRAGRWLSPPYEFLRPRKAFDRRNNAARLLGSINEADRGKLTGAR